MACPLAWDSSAPVGTDSECSSRAGCTAEERATPPSLVQSHPAPSLQASLLAQVPSASRHAFSVLLPYTAQDHLPSGDVTRSGLGPPSSVNNQDMPTNSPLEILFR